MAVLCDKEDIRFYKYDSSGKLYTNITPRAKNIGLISDCIATKTTNIQALLNLRYGIILLIPSLKPSFGSVLWDDSLLVSSVTICIHKYTCPNTSTVRHQSRKV